MQFRTSALRAGGLVAALAMVAALPAPLPPAAAAATHGRPTADARRVARTHTTTPPAVHAGSTPAVLRRGSGYDRRNGSGHVRQIQRALDRLGYAPGPVDGLFGPRTEGAVTLFQQDHGLVGDGVVGPQTLRQLAAASASHAPILRPGSGYGQSRGSSAVRAVQRRLDRLGFAAGPVDGLFGPRTEAAVREFQSRRGVAPDGIVGPQTRARLDAASANGRPQHGTLPQRRGHTPAPPAGKPAPASGPASDGQGNWSPSALLPVLFGALLMITALAQAFGARGRRAEELQLAPLRGVPQPPIISPRKPTRHASEALADVSVVIPARNEARNIEWVLRRLPAALREVILVDGHSTDDTVPRALTARPDLVVVEERDGGKGGALRTGFSIARGDYIVMIDADGSMDPREMGRYVQALRAGADLVKGSRFASGGGSSDISRPRHVGNKVLLALENSLFGSSFTDLCYGYQAFRRGSLDRLRLDASGFEIETQMIVRALKENLNVVEVPSYEWARRSGESNLHALRDGVRVLWTIVAEFIGVARRGHAVHARRRRPVVRR